MMIVRTRTELLLKGVAVEGRGRLWGQGSTSDQRSILKVNNFCSPKPVLLVVLYLWGPSRIGLRHRNQKTIISKKISNTNHCFMRENEDVFALRKSNLLRVQSKIN